MVQTPVMVNDASAEALRALALRRRHTDQLVTLALLASDILATSASTFVAMLGRQQVTVFGNSGLDIEGIVRPLSLLVVALWLGAIAVAGGYSPKQIGFGTVEYRRVLSASLATMASLGVAAYLFDYPLSRGYYFLLFVIGIPGLVLGRLTVRRLIQQLRTRGKLTTSVLVAGDLDHIDDVVAVLNRERWLGYVILGALAVDTDADETSHGVPIFGTPDDAVAILRATRAQAVIFAEGSFKRGHHFNEMARALEDSHARMIVVPSLTDVSAARMDVRPVAGIPLVNVEPPRSRAAGRWFKRLFDVVGASVLIVLFAPLMLAIAVAIKSTSRGGVLFRQVRAGRKGGHFECLKFRSMVVDAESQLGSLTHLNQSDGVLFKMVADPRVTPVGRVLRRFSLDELPQLFNVLRGDMSLVGPRPALPSEVSKYKKYVRRRLDVRPGMTGLWQVSGRSDLSWDETVRLDLYYVDNWSMVQDLSILLKTFGAVVRPRGAY